MDAFSPGTRRGSDEDMYLDAYALASRLARLADMYGVRLQDRVDYCLATDRRYWP